MYESLTPQEIHEGYEKVRAKCLAIYEEAMAKAKANHPGTPAALETGRRAISDFAWSYSNELETLERLCKQSERAAPKVD